MARRRVEGARQTLHDRLVEQRVEDADQLLEHGDPAAGLAAVRVALELDPEHRYGRLVAARALLAHGEAADAEAILVSLGRDPDALFISGSIAERRQDWQTAMDLFAAVPPDYPGRDAALRRVQLRWRLTQLPAHVQEALVSPRLTRSQLAVLLVDLMPQLETFSGGTVPVLSDIVDLPSHREILTAVRLDLLEVDPLEHSFHPHRVAEAREAGSVGGGPVPPSGPRDSRVVRVRVRGKLLLHSPRRADDGRDHGRSGTEPGTGRVAMTERKLQLLAGVELFSELDQDELAKVAGLAQVRTRAQGHDDLPRRRPRRRRLRRRQRQGQDHRDLDRR